jgi:biotin operon repressor
MNYLTYSQRLTYMLELIEKGALNSPVDLSEKFNCSEKTVRNMINTLRLMGHDINYSKKWKIYFIKHF